MKHPRASRWFKPSELLAAKLDPKVMSWLLDQGSLTRRLIDHCDGQFSVRVLSQVWIYPQLEEAQLLNIPLKQRVLLRQVQLLDDRQVLVYARSIIPLNTLHGKHRRLKYLANKPLGGYLFSNPRLCREHQTFAAISAKDPLFKVAFADQQPSTNNSSVKSIWGRRSLFTIDHKHLLVSEFFLPSLLP